MTEAQTADLVSVSKAYGKLFQRQAEFFARQAEYFGKLAAHDPATVEHVLSMPEYVEAEEPVAGAKRKKATVKRDPDMP
eukprot:9884-Eustigmatos_ZCMA.PRE.1